MILCKSDSYLYIPSSMDGFLYIPIFFLVGPVYACFLDMIMNNALFKSQTCYFVPSYFWLLVFLSFLSTGVTLLEKSIYFLSIQMSSGMAQFSTFLFPSWKSCFFGLMGVFVLQIVIFRSNQPPAF